MDRYSDELRVEAARKYCRGRLGLREVAHRPGVNVSSLRRWATAYGIHGARGGGAKDRGIYDTQFKLTVLRRVLSENLSRR